jgi:hypothetical protein
MNSTTGETEGREGTEAQKEQNAQKNRRKRSAAMQVR